MKVSEYKKLTTKEIICPSGLTVTIRKVLSIDYLMLGILPDTLMEYQRKAVAGEIEDTKMATDLQKMYLTKAVIPTQDFRIVDKEPEECTDNELPIVLLSEDDILCLVKEITLFTFDSESSKEDQFRDIQEEPLADAS